MTPGRFATFADVVDAVLPHVPVALGDAEALARLRACAGLLPPVASGGVECRLQHPGHPLDLHQCVPAADDGPARVVAHLTRLVSDARNVHPAWLRLQEFCRTWGDNETALNAVVREIWIECDHPPAYLEAGPSVFLSLSMAEPLLTHPGGHAALRDALETLRGAPLDAALARQLARCIAACDDGARVSHIGVMTSRPAPLRVNVKRLGHSTMPYLRAIGWPGDESAVAATVDWAHDVAKVTVCLDIDAAPSGRLGLECTPALGKWPMFLSELEAQGLCASEMHQALLDWPGDVNPMTAEGTWPVPLVMDALLHPCHLGLLARRLSHVKLTSEPGGPWGAKGYLWFGPEWIEQVATEPAALAVDLDRFYSSGDIPSWQAVLGDDLHYHLGHFIADEDLETGVRQAVRLLYPFIPPGASLLDAGCGWGGPARQLANEQGCRVRGITISRSQEAHCRSIGVDVERRDLEEYQAGAHVDVALMLESLEHVRDKTRLLRQLRHQADGLVLEVNCLADYRHHRSREPQFGGSMHMCTVEELIMIVEAAGWRVRSVTNRRRQAMRTLSLWRDALTRTFGAAPPPGQLGVFKRHVDEALVDPVRWAAANPLIDLVAD